jgi:hypothetical protein
MKFYCDDKLNVDIHLLEQIQHDEWKFHVEISYLWTST